VTTKVLRGVMLLPPEERSRRAAAGRAAKYPLRLVGAIKGAAGPWLVLDYCPATQHNTLNAARGIRVPGGVRCMCPRACALLDAFSKSAAAQKRVARRAELLASLKKPATRAPAPAPAKTPAPWPGSSISRYLRNVGRSGAPELRGRRCATETAKFDAALDGRHVSIAQAVCASCPVRPACAAWVLEAETPAGDWGGVYGGLSVADRRRYAVAQTRTER
jgi:hypothetical protein